MTLAVLGTVIAECSETVDGRCHDEFAPYLDATSSTYIPKADDEDHRLTVRATYVDGFVGSETNGSVRPVPQRRTMQS